MTRDDYDRLLDRAKALVSADREAEHKWNGRVGFTHFEEYFLPIDIVHRILDLKEVINDEG
jgi:hypothetical protein